MKKSEEIYKTIFNNLPDIYYETNLDGIGIYPWKYFLDLLWDKKIFILTKH